MDLKIAPIEVNRQVTQSDYDKSKDYQGDRPADGIGKILSGQIHNVADYCKRADC